MKMKKKEFIVCIVAIVLIAAIGIAYSLSKAGSKTDEPKKIEKTAKREDKKKVKTARDKASKAEDEKTNAKSDGKSEDEKKDDGTEKAVKSENKGSKTSSSAKSSSSSASTPSSSSSSSSSGTAPAPKPKRWVVDTPAWNEEVRQPVYVNTWWVKFVDGTTKIYYNEAEAYSLYRDRPDIVDSWGTGERVPDPSGATEVVGYIPHAEVGHWE
jgi:protein C41G7.6, confirmed by transcript evidence